MTAMRKDLDRYTTDDVHSLVSGAHAELSLIGDRLLGAKRMDQATRSDLGHRIHLQRVRLRTALLKIENA